MSSEPMTSKLREAVKGSLREICAMMFTNALRGTNTTEQREPLKEAVLDEATDRILALMPLGGVPDLRAFGYAPGNYFCYCGSCGEQHTADKRASRCLTCAEKACASHSADNEQQDTLSCTPEECDRRDSAIWKGWL